MPFATDAVVQKLVDGTWARGTAGSSVGNQTWRVATPGEGGAYQNPGWLSVQVTRPRPQVAVLAARGHGMVYVNGEPRGGDVYGYGFVEIPIKLNSGVNELLFASGRGPLVANLRSPSAPVLFLAGDRTLPDLVRGERRALVAGIPLANCTEQTQRLLVVARHGSNEVETTVSLAPLAVQKVAIALPEIVAGESDEKVRLAVRPERGRDELATTEITLASRAKTDLHRRTFFSAIDGSAQYYAVQPASDPDISRPALVISVHGASVEASGQAGAYGQKTWAHIVCPTNRRPFGFDWEEWGRRDALEVLADARGRYNTDPTRQYLTGHSMGGHGTWYLGSVDSDQWAAIAPCAGWSTFWSYGGALRIEQPDPLEAQLVRATGVSDTLAALRNTATLGVFVLHGDKDETVPVAQARDMRERLAAFHRDVDWFEQPGGGHWYDTTEEPGADCVDFPPLFSFFNRRRLPDPREVKHVAFTSLHPGLNARNRWATIETVETWGMPGSVDITLQPSGRKVIGTTENVKRLSLDLKHWGEGPISVVLDGGEAVSVTPGSDGAVRLEKGMTWQVAGVWSPDQKHPGRCGPFKAAFDREFVLVYGTTGTPAENAWSLAKARYDADVWWYRGNGQAVMVADRDFRPTAYLHRNVIVYGNEDTNSAWKLLLRGSPIRVRRDEVDVGEESWSGPGVATLFCRPRTDSGVAMVGAVGGSGLAGMRATDRMPYFTSGVHFPDFTVFSSLAPSEATKSLKAIGWFGQDWGLETGEVAWRP